MIKNLSIFFKKCDRFFYAQTYQASFVYLKTGLLRDPERGKVAQKPSHFFSKNVLVILYPNPSSELGVWV
jgi:hypothetical protein